MLAGLIPERTPNFHNIKGGVLSFDRKISLQLPLHKTKDSTKSTRNEETKIMKQKKIYIKKSV